MSSSTSQQSDKKEGLIVGVLFLVVVGLAFGLTTLDVEPVDEPIEEPEAEQAPPSAMDQDVVEFAEALSASGATEAEELASLGMESLLEQDPEDLTLDGEPIPEVDDDIPIMKDKLYNDLLVYDTSNPVLGKDGKPVNVPVPPTVVPSFAQDNAGKRLNPTPSPETQEAEAPATEAAAEAAEPAPQTVGDRMSSASDKLKRGDPRGAAEEYKKVLSEKPGYTKARVDLAQALYEMNDTPGATKALDTALKAQPTHAKALLLRASISQADGRSGEARKFYQRFVDNHPTSPKVRAVQSILNRL